MKKILISVIILLLIILSAFALTKGINFLNIKSINDIKAASNKLENDFNEANELSNKTYPAEVEGLEEAIKKLKISKQEYESKNLYNKEQTSLGTLEIKTYKIHYLWTKLGNYRKDRGVKTLNLDLKSTQVQDVYNLEFTLVGNYTNITDFIYDIENDEELNFEIKNFTISSQIENISNENSDNKNESQNSILKNNNNNDSNNNNSNSNNNNYNSNITNLEQSSKSDGTTLQARFTVENIGITLD